MIRARQEGRPETEILAEMKEAHRRDLAAFDVHFDHYGSTNSEANRELCHEVWQALRDIPYGELVSYKAIAQAIGNPKAVRAVGSANGRNPIPIIVPCHRVIGSDGTLTGFGGGLETKQRLIDLEQARI